jgi:hypothetical protein
MFKRRQNFQVRRRVAVDKLSELNWIELLVVVLVVVAVAVLAV